ncbi:MAG: hypothetical protein JWR84_1123 [Caulobacter sp.]|nr:hypothetical protein [Caulobacter sp.]
MMTARGIPPMKPADNVGRRRFSIRWILAAAGIAAFVIVVVWLVFAYVIPDGVADGKADERDGAAAILAAKAAVETRLPDAQSMAFDKVSVVWLGEAPAVCGWVDVDEPQDSFDGPERFVYVDGQVMLEQLDGSDAVKQRWDDACD